MTEHAEKLTLIRASLAAAGLAAVRLRGTDWFAWATAGASNTVLLTTDTGVAELLVTADAAFVITDEIEADRLRAEELPPGLPLWSHPWAAPQLRDRFVAERCGRGPLASDRPVGAELPLPAALRTARASLGPAELERYRRLGRDAATAMTEVLQSARPEWSGHQLAGAGAEALWGRGIHPALVLVGDARRLPLHRHPTPSRDPLGERAMLVFCARRHGLYANLTRFVYFRPPTSEQRRIDAAVAEVEAAAFAASRPGRTLAEVYAAIVDAYARAGHAGAEARHHQGGPCGYLARDAIATPERHAALAQDGAVAWNPSLPGAKIEDTAVVHADGLELLTVDPAWPSRQVHGRARPALLER